MIVPTSHPVVIIDSADYLVGFALQNLDGTNDVFISTNEEGLNRIAPLGMPAGAAPGDDIDVIVIFHAGGSFSPPIPFSGKLFGRAVGLPVFLRKIVWRATLP